MENEKPVARRPAWIPVVQAAQFLVSLIILGLSAWLIHGKYFDTLGYDIFCCLLTWIVVALLLVSSYISSLHALTNPLITIGANALMVLFWLAAMGATAHLRSTFKYDAYVYGCYDDGSSVDSTTCLVGREVEKRAAVATRTGLSCMSAIAGLSAIEMLLFIAVLVPSILTWKSSRSKTTSTTPITHEPQKPEGSYPMSTPAPQQPQYAPPPQQGHPQQQYPQTYTPAQQPQYAPVSPQQQPQQPYPQTYAPAQQPHQQYEKEGVNGEKRYEVPAQSMPGPPGGQHAELPSPN